MNAAPRRIADLGEAARRCAAALNLEPYGGNP